MRICNLQNYEICKLLLENGANPNIQDYEHEITPIIYTITLKDKNILNLLLKYNADINIQDYYGENLMVPIISLANKISHIHGYSFKIIEEDLFELQILKTPADKLDQIVEEAKEEINNYLEIMI